MSAWSIRHATPRDAAAIRRLAEAGLATYGEFTPGWTRPKAFDEANARRGSELLADPDFFCLLAEANGRPIAHVGFAAAPIAGLAHLWQLFVDREWWGSGVGAELLDAAVGEGRERGFESMRLFTPRDHARARRFYEREGWRPGGVEVNAESTMLGLAIVEYVIDL
jgi:GNAT superfamily N-acetyltransferase